MAQRTIIDNEDPLLPDYNDKGKRFSHMTIEELVESDYQICVLEPATPGQTRFGTTNPGLYLRDRGAKRPMLRDYILSFDEIKETGIRGAIAKERRYWYWRAKSCFLAKESPEEVQRVRDGWFRHQSLLEGPRITSKEQVDYATIIKAHAYDPTALVYILKVHRDISCTLLGKQDIHAALGEDFPTKLEVSAIHSLMCGWKPTIFHHDGGTCESCRSTDLANTGQPRRVQNTKYDAMTLPCGRHAHLDEESDKSHCLGSCFNCVARGRICDKIHPPHNVHQTLRDIEEFLKDTSRRDAHVDSRELINKATRLAQVHNQDVVLNALEHREIDVNFTTSKYTVITPEDDASTTEEMNMDEDQTEEIDIDSNQEAGPPAPSMEVSARSACTDDWIKIWSSRDHPSRKEKVYVRPRIRARRLSPPPSEPLTKSGKTASKRGASSSAAPIPKKSNRSSASSGGTIYPSSLSL